MSLKDLGWANSWPWTKESGLEYPQIVKDCMAAGHKTESKDCGRPLHRGLDTQTSCEECGYVYHTDSSD